MPLIAKYAVPSIISMLVGAVYNLTDQIFIGHVVGVVGNAAWIIAVPFAYIRKDKLVFFPLQGPFQLPPECVGDGNLDSFPRRPLCF